MAIFVTGDTHAPVDIDKLEEINFPQRKDLNKEDFVIIAGDFGAIWSGTDVDVKWLRWFDSLPFTTLFVDGNHENFPLLFSYPQEMFMGGAVHKITDSIYHLQRGQVYTIDGVKIFTFGGAHSVDKLDRFEGRSWWPEERPTENEFLAGLANLAEAGNAVDVIITHTIHDRIVSLFGYTLYDNPHNSYFAHIADNVDFGHWYFGHLHRDAHVGTKYTAMYDKIHRIK